METIKQCMKSVKVKDTRKTRLTLTRLTTFVTMNRFHILFWCFHCWLWTSKYRLDDILANELPPVQRTQTYIRCSEDVQDVFRTSYVQPIYFLWPGGNKWHHKTNVNMTIKESYETSVTLWEILSLNLNQVPPDSTYWIFRYISLVAIFKKSFGKMCQKLF